MEVWGRRGQGNGPKAEMDKTDRAKGLGRRTREGIYKSGIKLTAHPDRGWGGGGETEKIPRPPLGGGGGETERTERKKEGGRTKRNQNGKTEKARIKTDRQTDRQTDRLPFSKACRHIPRLGKA